MTTEKTTATTTTGNRATVAGVLLPSPAGPQRSALGAPVTQIQLQLLTPFGEPFALPVQLAGQAEQQYRLRRGQSRNLVVTGQVRLALQHDARFARPDDVLGEAVRRMELVAETVRPLGPEETVGASLVELEGTVVGQPLPRPHPHLPTRDAIEVTLACTVPHTVQVGGTALSRTLSYRVRLAVPRRARNARYLYVLGNRVLVRGELDCVMVRWLPDGADGATAYQQAEDAWALAQERFAHYPRRLAEEREAYFEAMRQFELTPRWHVLVGEVVPRRGAIRVREALGGESGSEGQRLRPRSRRGKRTGGQRGEERRATLPEPAAVRHAKPELALAVGEQPAVLPEDAAGPAEEPAVLPEGAVELVEVPAVLPGGGADAPPDVEAQAHAEALVEGEPGEPVEP